MLQPVKVAVDQPEPAVGLGACELNHLQSLWSLATGPGQHSNCAFDVPDGSSDGSTDGLARLMLPIAS